MSAPLRVGFVGSATYRLMPAIVRAARDAMPGVRLQITGEKITPALEDALLENRLDVAVLRPPVRAAELTLTPVEAGRLRAAHLDLRRLLRGPRHQVGHGPVGQQSLGAGDERRTPEGGRRGASPGRCGHGVSMPGASDTSSAPEAGRPVAGVRVDNLALLAAGARGRCARRPSRCAGSG